MRFTYSWLLDCLETDWSACAIADKLSAIGVEAWVVDGGDMARDGLVVAEVLDVVPHPDASKLNVCKVSNGIESLQVVCGASNVRVGMYTVLACIGSCVPKSGVRVQRVVLRGVESFGMLCSFDELGVGVEEDGIADLPTGQYGVGERFFPEDQVIEVSITPNRGDCLGLYAIARELAAAGVGKLKDFPYCVRHSSSSPTPITLDVRSESVFVGRCIRSVDNTVPTPRWIRDRLLAAGVKSISCVVDIINYAMIFLNRPMHVYDLDKIHGRGLIVENATARSKFIALNGKEFDVEVGDLVVRDSEGAVHCLAGIIGADQVKCLGETKNVFLESAWYDPVEIALTSRRIKLSTDASYRFSRYVDPGSIENGLEYATHLIVQCCGGEVCSLVSAGSRSQCVSQVDFDPGDVSRVCNVSMEDAQIRSILEGLGFSVDVDGEEFWKVGIPTWRCDIGRSRDLVEEVVRIHGYDKIQEQAMDPGGLLAEGGVIPLLDDSFLNRIRSLMLSSGLTEVMTWSFLSGSIAEKLGFDVGSLYIENPISNQFDAMRPSLLPNLLQVAANNQASGVESVAIFELGDIYLDLAMSEKAVCGLRSGDNVARNPHESVRRFDFFDVKFDVESVFLQFGISCRSLEFREGVLRSYVHPARSASIYYEGVLCGHVGELHPAFVEFFGLKSPAVFFEMFLSKIPQVEIQSSSVFTVSKYQTVRRDFAFVLDENVRSSALVSTIAGVDYVEDASVFDVYKGGGIPDGKVSMAVTVLMVSAFSTMTEAEIKKVTDTIISVVEEGLGGKLRLESS